MQLCCPSEGNADFSPGLPGCTVREVMPGPLVISSLISSSSLHRLFHDFPTDTQPKSARKTIRQLRILNELCSAAGTGGNDSTCAVEALAEPAGTRHG